MRKRVKRDIYASPLDFQRLHPDFEEQKGEPEMEVELHRDLGYVPAEGGPNQIGNLEDGPVVPDNVGAERQVLLHGAHQHVGVQDHRLPLLQRSSSDGPGSAGHA